MKKVWKIKGLDCANCAAELEERLGNIKGVRLAAVSFLAQTVTVECDTEEAKERARACVSTFEEVEIVGEENESGRTVLRLENLHCAACAMDLEEILKKISGVKDASVSFVAQTAMIEVETPDAVQKAVKAANKFEKVRVVNADELIKKPTKGLSKDALRLSVSGLFFLVAILFEAFWVATAGRICSYLCYGVSYLTVGLSVWIATVKNIAKGKVFDENFLMTIASVGAILLGAFGSGSREGLTEGVAVMFLYQLGEWLQSLAVGSSRKSLTELMKLKSEKAVRLTELGAEEMKPEELNEGDRCLVKVGEKVPADGILLSQQAEVDTKSLTGEPLPKTFLKGEEILSGCVGVGSAFEIQVVRKSEDSAAAKILQLVENSASKKAAPEKFITKFARVYTPLVCLLALVVAFLAPAVNALLSGGGYGAHFARWAQSALNLLIIACPCALVISVPLTYFGGIGACAKAGVLVKGAVYLDEAANAKHAVFDKTGTLTRGDFSIVLVKPAEKTEKEELLFWAATAEQGSSHPIAKAFSSIGFERALPLPEKTEERAGGGVTAYLTDTTITVGKAEYLKEKGVAVEEIDGAEHTVVYAAKNGEYLGAILIGDQIKLEAKDCIEKIKALGLDAYMLTGDQKARAELTAQKLGGITAVSELLPEEKLEKAKELTRGEKWLYAGDGINDAPVMAAADCAVSMGKLGSAAAVEASDLVLVGDNLSALPKALQIARKTKKLVFENIVFSVAAKAAFMALGIWGVLPLWAAVFGDVGLMLLAVLNSLRVKTEK